MSRKVFDRLASFTGLGLTIVLLVAGGLMIWGQSYATSNVHNQLAAQKIYFPARAEIATAKHQYAITGKTTDPEFPNRAMISHIARYAGQQVLTGQQAETYADWFIGQHLAAMPYGGVYSKVSAAARAAKPGSAQAAKLSALQGTVFQGTTLRGMLLEAYAFGTIGMVMLWGAVASFALAVLMALLTALGFRHAALVNEDEQIGRHVSSAKLAAHGI